MMSTKGFLTRIQTHIYIYTCIIYVGVWSNGQFLWVGDDQPMPKSSFRPSYLLPIPSIPCRISWTANVVPKKFRPTPHPKKISPDLGTSPRPSCRPFEAEAPVYAPHLRVRALRGGGLAGARLATPEVGDPESETQNGGGGSKKRGNPFFVPFAEFISYMFPFLFLR